MSPRAYKELSKFAGYKIAERGVITVKVGLVNLNHKKNFNMSYF